MTNKHRREFLKGAIATSWIVSATPHFFAFDLFAQEPTRLFIDVSTGFQKVQTGHLKFGTQRSPAGDVISADSRSLLFNGRPWLPVMGEFHYSRFPENEWRTELLKMKSGGIDLVSTYVFWIHHEEVKDTFDWNGQRNLRQFVKLCGEVGVNAVVRIGPWCHGEVRNGGLPDWILQASYKARSDESGYLDRVRKLYSEIATQLSGQLWKDGGPVVAIQLENEYRGPAEHLLTLKRIAREAGMDVPIYTRTGWPELRTKMPDGEIFPLFGAYAEGFWDRELTPMPAKYGDAFLFKLARTDTSIEFVDHAARKEGDETGSYPYFCCEIGGGMVTSYHRRIRIDPADIDSVSLVKLGSGNNLHGYYMYHGGTNPIGKLTTLQESQATKYWNDVPVKSYEFQAPIGEFGQLNPHYHSLRRLHTFLRDFGDRLATMTSFVPVVQPANSKDTGALRWAVRSDGESGFIFVNNYQRLQSMPAKQGVQFELKLKSKTLRVPSRPIDVAADSSFIWPFNLDLDVVKLRHSTAQLVCRLTDGRTSYFVFSEVVGIPAEFVFDSGEAKFISANCTVAREAGQLRIHEIKAALRSFAEFTHNGRVVKVLLVTDADSRKLWKLSDRMVITSAGVVEDNAEMRLNHEVGERTTFSVLPSSARVATTGSALKSVRSGDFASYSIATRAKAKATVRSEKLKSAGPAREIKKGSQGVAEAPIDSDFDGAAVWRIHLTPGDPNNEVVLRIKYLGDVARVYLDGQLLTDNFYNGNAFEVGLNRYPSIYRGELLLKVLPLRKDAPIYMAKDAWPSFDANEVSVAKVDAMELIEQTTTRVQFK